MIDHRESALKEAIWKYTMRLETMNPATDIKARQMAIRITMEKILDEVFDLVYSTDLPEEENENDN